eukprot:GHVO01015679.1.p1 GENE.GHVO01015679.1~~GHVO01015679.1.p1  ORF type:complete len:107 (+),score=1.15 GHVO01015679.1:478-798(+)
MEHYGIHGRELEWFRNYLCGRSQVVKHNGVSQAKVVSVGVPQGSVLGPIVFLLFVNAILVNLLLLVSVTYMLMMLYCFVMVKLLMKSRLTCKTVSPMSINGIARIG